MISNNVLYHYTSFDTALKILNSSSLRFNNIRNQIDPNEYTKGNLSTWFASGDDIATADEDRNKFNERNESRVKHHQCISFSSNTQIVNDINVTKLQYILNEVNKKYNIQESGFRHYHMQSGFDKSRMWETYADNYSGVCLVLDRRKVIDTALVSNITTGYINYLTNFRSVAYDKKKENSLISQIDNSYFQKGIDYRDESEFRLLVNSADVEFFDIKDSIVGIIYGPNSEAKLYKKIVENSFKEFSLNHIEYAISKNSISNIFYEMN